MAILERKDMLNKRQITDQTIELITNIRYDNNVPVLAEWDDAFDKSKRFLTDEQMVQLEKYLNTMELN
jgi:hypothetical protein